MTARFPQVGNVEKNEVTCAASHSTLTHTAQSERKSQFGAALRNRMTSPHVQIWQSVRIAFSDAAS